MKSIMIVVSFLMGFSGMIYGQTSNNVQNINWELNEAKEVILITYDLEKVNHYRNFDIALTALLDGQRVPVHQVIGDLGKQVEAGLGKRIEWKVFQDIPNGLKGMLEFEIQATNPPQSDIDQDGIPDRDDKCPFKAGPAFREGCPAPKVPQTAGLISLATMGATLTTTGLIKQSQATKAYEEEYPQLGNPVSPEYDPEAADALYQQLRKDHKKGNLLLIGGAAVLTVTGAILIRRIIKDKQRAKQSSISWQPYLYPEFQSHKKGVSMTAGLGLSVKF